MDKCTVLAHPLPTPCPHSALSRPHPHRFCNNDSWKRQRHRLRPVPALLRHPRKSVYGILRPIPAVIPRGNAKNNNWCKVHASTERGHRSRDLSSRGHRPRQRGGVSLQSCRVTNQCQSYTLSICGPRQLGPTPVPVPVPVQDYHPDCQFSVNSCGIYTYYSRIIPPHAEPAQSSTQARAQGTATRRIAVIRRACFEEGSRTEPVGLPGCLAAGARSASGPGSTLPPGSPIRQGVEHAAQGSEVCHRSTGTHAVRGREPGRVDRHPGLVTG